MNDITFWMAGGVILFLIVPLLSWIGNLKNQLDRSEMERKMEQERHRRELEEKEQQLSKARSVPFRMKLIFSVMLSGIAKQMFDEPFIAVGVLASTLLAMIFDGFDA
ncbi:MAG: hypothetical protein KF734_10710 [Saprospiraceae bacterium]|nr:hypothetical protein [Saprospiraceae bacterium]